MAKYVLGHYRYHDRSGAIIASMTDQPQAVVSETIPNSVPWTPTETPRDTIISVAEAAIRLGVTQDAVRKRLQRGSLPGIKTGQSWDVIETEELKKATTSPSHATQDSVTRHPDEVLHVTDTSLVDHLQDEVAVRDNVISDLRQRLDWAQSNVDAKDKLLADVLADLGRQRERTDVLQAQYQQAGEKIRQLEAGEAPQTSSDAPEHEERPQESIGGLKGWWNRLWAIPDDR